MNNTLLIFKDELRGFALSWVMISLWVGLPLITVIIYFVSPMGKQMEMMPGQFVPMLYFVGIMISSTGGTLAEIMLGVDMVNEKNRRVYDLFMIRPVPRSAILWGKFAAVSICVSIACLLALVMGLAVDAAQGAHIGSLTLRMALEAFVTCLGVVVISAATGILVGVISSSVLISVLILLYAGQLLFIVPMLPTMLGLPDYLWVATLLSVGMAVGLMLVAITIFKRKEF